MGRPGRLKKGGEEKNRAEMNTDPHQQEPVAPLAKIPEGWAAIQKHQAAARTKQMDWASDTGPLTTNPGGEDGAQRKNPIFHLPKMTQDDAQASLEPSEKATHACQLPRENWVVHLLPLGGSATGSAQPNLVCPGKVSEHQEGGARPVGVQPRRSKSALPETEPERGGPPISPGTDQTGQEVATTGNSLHAQRCQAGGLGELSGGANQTPATTTA